MEKRTREESDYQSAILSFLADVSADSKTPLSVEKWAERKFYEVLPKVRTAQVRWTDMVLAHSREKIEDVRMGIYEHD